MRRLKLINWVKQQHEGQLIKETNEPYFDHLLTVANRVADAAPLTYEIGLCHDLYEKTEATPAILEVQLKEFGYNLDEAEHISGCVTELTRQFTKANNPLPKKLRKELEDERLTYISADAQTVKYADLSYNADWMMAHDRHHVKDYLQRQLELVENMTEGSSVLRDEVLEQFIDLLNCFNV